MVAFAIASNPTMVRYMDMDYVRAILNGEVEIWSLPCGDDEIQKQECMAL